MQNQPVKFGPLVLSFALAMAFTSSPARPQTDAIMTQDRPIVDQTFSNPSESGSMGQFGGDMKSMPPDRTLLPKLGLSPLLDPSLTETLQRQQAAQERDILERNRQRERLEEQRRQSPGFRGFYSDSQ